MFDHLKKVLLGATDALSYRQIAADLGMNEDAARKAARRLRQCYRTVMRERIADTVDEPARIDDEIRDLFAALNS
jgi:DNA-directed RNA polymerase specialized sigma24 family protein